MPGPTGRHCPSPQARQSPANQIHHLRTASGKGRQWLTHTGVEIIAAVVCHQCWNIYSEKHMCPYILIQISMHTKLNSHTSTLPLTCERSPDTNMWNCVFKGLATLKKSHAQQRSVYLTLGPPPVIKTALSKPSSSERSSSSAAGGGRGGGCWRIGDIHAWWLQLTSETRKEFYLVPPGTYRKRNKKRESKAIKQRERLTHEHRDTQPRSL